MSDRPLTVKEAKAMFEATDSARLQEEERKRLAKDRWTKESAWAWLAENAVAIREAKTEEERKNLIAAREEFKELTFALRYGW